MKTYTDYEIIKAAQEWLKTYRSVEYPRLIREDVIAEYLKHLTGWTIWTGGECPVPEDTKIEYMVVSGNCASEKYPQHSRWKHNGTGSDIIAYRIVEPDISELRGWCLVETYNGLTSVEWARANGLASSKGRTDFTSWESVRRLGWKVRKLTVEDIIDEA